LPVAISCTLSAASDAVPDAASVELVPAVDGPKFMQPFPVPAGGLLQGQAMTPFCPGTQKSVPVLRHHGRSVKAGTEQKKAIPQTLHR
jgi:hypothetical protein